MYRNAQSGFSGANEFYLEPSTPPGNYRSRKNGENSPSEFSPGLLDLHSFDTELIPEVGRSLGIFQRFFFFFLDFGSYRMVCAWHGH